MFDDNQVEEDVSYPVNRARTVDPTAQIMILSVGLVATSNRHTDRRIGEIRVSRLIDREFCKKKSSGAASMSSSSAPSSSQVSAPETAPSPSVEAADSSANQPAAPPPPPDSPLSTLELQPFFHEYVLGGAAAVPYSCLTALTGISSQTLCECGRPLAEAAGRLQRDLQALRGGRPPVLGAPQAPQGPLNVRAPPPPMLGTAHLQRTKPPPTAASAAANSLSAPPAAYSGPVVLVGYEVSHAILRELGIVEGTHYDELVDIREVCVLRDIFRSKSYFSIADIAVGLKVPLKWRPAVNAAAASAPATHAQQQLQQANNFSSSTGAATSSSVAAASSKDPEKLRLQRNPRTTSTNSWIYARVFTLLRAASDKQLEAFKRRLALAPGTMSHEEAFDYAHDSVCLTSIAAKCTCRASSSSAAFAPPEGAAKAVGGGAIISVPGTRNNKGSRRAASPGRGAASAEAPSSQQQHLHHRHHQHNQHHKGGSLSTTAVAFDPSVALHTHFGEQQPAAVSGFHHHQHHQHHLGQMYPALSTTHHHHAALFAADHAAAMRYSPAAAAAAYLQQQHFGSGLLPPNQQQQWLQAQAQQAATLFNHQHQQQQQQQHQTAAPSGEAHHHRNRRGRGNRQQQQQPQPTPGGGGGHQQHQEATPSAVHPHHHHHAPEPSSIGGVMLPASTVRVGAGNSNHANNKQQQQQHQQRHVAPNNAIQQQPLMSTNGRFPLPKPKAQQPVAPQAQPDSTQLAPAKSTTNESPAAKRPDESFTVTTGTAPAQPRAINPTATSVGVAESDGASGGWASVGASGASSLPPPSSVSWAWAGPDVHVPIAAVTKQHMPLPPDGGGGQ